MQFLLTPPSKSLLRQWLGGGSCRVLISKRGGTVYYVKVHGRLNFLSLCTKAALIY